MDYRQSRAVAFGLFAAFWALMALVSGSPWFLIGTAFFAFWSWTYW